MTNARATMIRERLTRELQPVKLEIIDESAKHAGHAGAASGGGHFIGNIFSPAVEKKKHIQRHPRVYDSLGEIMHSEIHALSIQAKTPQES